MCKMYLQNMKILVKSQAEFGCQVPTQNILLATVLFKLKLLEHVTMHTPGKTFKLILILLTDK